MAKSKVDILKDLSNDYVDVRFGFEPKATDAPKEAGVFTVTEKGLVVGIGDEDPLKFPSEEKVTEMIALGGGGGGVSLDNYYNKSEVDSKVQTINSAVANKADASTVYTKGEVYNKTEVDAKLEGVTAGGGTPIATTTTVGTVKPSAEHFNIQADGTLTIKNPGSGGGTAIDEGEINVKSHGAKGDGVTDDTEAFKTAIAECLENKKTLYIPSGTYKLASVPKEGFLCSVYKPETSNPATYSLRMRGAGRQNTKLVWSPVEEWCVLFLHREMFECRDMQITDPTFANDRGQPSHSNLSTRATDYKGIVFATQPTAQSAESNWSELEIYGYFKYAFYKRYIVWETYKNIFTRYMLAHYVFALGGGPAGNSKGDNTKQWTWEDKVAAYKDPKTPPQRGWNGNDGSNQQAWFQNCLVMDNCYMDHGAVGIFGSVMGMGNCNITIQNMKKKFCNILPFMRNEFGTGLYLFGRSQHDPLKSNSIQYYYTEGTERPIKLEEAGQMHIGGLFFQRPNSEFNAEAIYMWNSKLTIGASHIESRTKYARLMGGSHLTTLVDSQAGGATEVDGSSYLQRGVLEKNGFAGSIGNLTTKITQLEGKITALEEEVKNSSIKIPGKDKLLLNVGRNDFKLKDDTSNNQTRVTLGYAPYSQKNSVTFKYQVQANPAENAAPRVSDQAHYGPFIEQASLNAESRGVVTESNDLIIGKNKPHTGWVLQNNEGLDLNQPFSVLVTCKVSGELGEWVQLFYMLDADSIAPAGSENSVAIKGRAGHNGMRIEIANGPTNKFRLLSGNGNNGKCMEPIITEWNVSDAQSDYVTLLITSDGTNVKFYKNLDNATAMTKTLTNKTGKFKVFGFNGSKACNVFVKKAMIWKGHCVLPTEFEELKAYINS